MIQLMNGNDLSQEDAKWIIDIINSTGSVKHVENVIGECLSKAKEKIIQLRETRVKKLFLDVCNNPFGEWYWLEPTV